MDKYMTATEAQQRFLQLLDEVESGDQVIVTRRGAPRAVLIDFEKLETLKSLARLWQDPESLRAMKESLDDAKEGRMLKLKGVPTIDAILKTARTRRVLRG